MKRILFYYSQLNIGGAEKSLIRLMNAFTSHGDDVTYLGRYSGGSGEYLLNDEVKKSWLSSSLNRSGKLYYYFSLLRSHIERFFSIREIREWRKFDIALIGLQGLSPKLVINNLKSQKLCIFIRNDISAISGKSRVIENLKKYIDRIDYFICVAETVKQSLVKEIPEASSKAIVIYNVLSVDDMKHKLKDASNPFKNETDTVFRIVTVCRISDKSKAIFRMVRICNRLVKEGYKFRWYIVGDGADFTGLRQAISDFGLNEVMITPGRIDNPFGYYRDCDLVAMLSYYEGLCGVVNEAKISGKAIIATKVSGIDEQLNHGLNGWIVDNDEESIFNGMKGLLDDHKLLKSLTNDVYPDALINDNAKVEKLYRLIEG